MQRKTLKVVCGTILLGVPEMAFGAGLGDLSLKEWLLPLVPFLFILLVIPFTTFRTRKLTETITRRSYEHYDRIEAQLARIADALEKRDRES
jgi:hypothetical protein